MLTDAVAPVLALAQVAGHPVEFCEEDVRGAGQRDADAGCSDGADEVLRVAALEALYGLLPLLGRVVAREGDAVQL